MVMFEVFVSLGCFLSFSASKTGCCWYSEHDSAPVGSWNRCPTGCHNEHHILCHFTGELTHGSEVVAGDLLDTGFRWVFLGKKHNQLSCLFFFLTAAF